MKHVRLPRHRLRPAPWFAALLLILPALPSAAVGGPRQDRTSTSETASRLAETHVASAIAVARLDAGNTLLAAEIARLEGASRGSSPAEWLRELGKVDAEMRSALGEVIQQGVDPLVENHEQSLAALRERVAEAQASWLEVRTDLNRAELLLSEIRDSRLIAGQLASLLSVDKRWFWLFGVIAVAALLGVVCHDRRHEIRKLLNGGRPKAMGLSKLLAVLLVLMTAATLAMFLLGDQIYEALLTAGVGSADSPRHELQRRASQLEAEQMALAAARQSLEKLRDELQAAFCRQFADVLPPRNRLPLCWQQLRDGAIQAAEEIAAYRAAFGGWESDRAELAECTEQLRSQSAATIGTLRLRHSIRACFGVLLLGLTAGGGLWYWGGVAGRRKATRETCPLCLGQGSLESEETAAPEDNSGDLRLVRCHHVISKNPHEQCDFSFREAYRPMTKLCFPTLGIPQAGKTHWLAMLYWVLNRGSYPKTIQFERVRSQSAENFDRIVEEILNTRIGTAATQQDRIPHPLVFNFRDRDPIGRSNVLVNIFDYSGEVTSEMDVRDYRRRRALDADGFLFFLDPTYPSEVQAKALADFREDLRLIKGVKAGRRLRLPVALCVSKIDLLARHDYRLEDGRDAIAAFYEDLARIDPSGESTALAVLEQRSQLTQRLHNVIWPGWQIERQVDDLFGGRFAFFPLTPVGLDGRGETDLSLRTISPFGLLEPLLWLLQMTGYPVLQ